MWSSTKITHPRPSVYHCMLQNHLALAQRARPCAPCLSNRIQNIDGSNRKCKKKGTLNTCKMFKMSSLSPFADLPFTFATQSHCLIESSLWWVPQKNARLQASAGMSCGWPKAPGFHGIPSGTQTWFAGKSTIYGGLSNKTLHLQGVFHCHASACLTTRGAFPFFLIIGGSCPPWKKCWRTIAGVPKLRCKLVGVVSLLHYIATYFVGEIQCLYCILYWILAILYLSPTLFKFVIEH